ncbi:hypothetical protein GB931_08070 [Modestobacter sp. I12A-02628]|uniref:Uncharacterized protein n=1 Tax=Goekera deserti TaxID=2497753 RepID=A0A7K3WFE7_9ACTN|nr:hypothetical protein [Goekera deserti]MPQ97879.1 hypothetical protein [Goekera deserti]NDI48525.1 hypothetical protein [Goekera deserti]NEL55096.1 hypothetical protein [Goekera deserti]
MRRQFLAGIAAAVGVIAAASLVPGATPTAFADYDVSPAPLSPAESEQVVDDCRALGPLSMGDAIAPAVPVLAERRGSWSYVVLVSDTQVTTCLVRRGAAAADDLVLASGGGRTPDTSARPVTGVRLDGSTFTQAMPGEEPSPDAFGSAVGQAAPGVTAVDVVLPGDRVVHTTLTPDGWWGAWWPGGLDSEGNGQATALRYADSAGTVVEVPYGDG